MPKVDLTVTISVILGCAAVVSPVLTAIINNIHQHIMRSKEMKHEMKIKTIDYQRLVLETYVTNTAKCLQHPHTGTILEYSESYVKARTYVNRDIEQQMDEIEKSIHQENYKNAYEIFTTTLLPALKSKIQTL